MLIFPRKIFILISFLLILAKAWAGNPDTLSLNKSSDTIFVRKFTSQQFFCREEYSSPDTLLDNLKRYFPKNSLGNPGTALIPILLPERAPNAGAQYWPNHFDYYLFDRDNVEYFYTRNPYTNVYLASGTKEEQYFRARHSQNISRQLNMAVGFTKLRSQGDYLRQAGNHTSAFLSSNYLSKNRKYFLSGNLVYNNLKVQENGGIADDAEFENAGFSDKKLIDVNLSTAQRRIWNKGAFLKHGITYGGKSSDTSNVIPAAKGSFTHTVSVEDNSIVFLDSDPDTGFYENILLDSTQTRDSVYYWKIENELAWAMNGNSSLCKPMLQFSIAHQYWKVKQLAIDSGMQNLIARGGYQGHANRLAWGVNGEYAFAGSQQGDAHSEASVKYLLRDSSSSVEITNNFSSKNPDFIFNRYSSNHYEWSYDWNKYQINVTSAVFSSKKLKFSAGASAVMYNDPLYFDVNARPRQYTGRINAYGAFIKKNFRLGKWVSANTVRYQYVPEATVIRLPAIVSENAIYYENSLFKRALGIQAGIDVYYTSSFMGNAYMPVTGQYYIQNEKRIGNYPYVDVFVNLKIKTVRAFLKYEHANAGLLGNTYYLVPHHPLFDASFVFGLSWDFYN